MRTAKPDLESAATALQSYQFSQATLRMKLLIRLVDIERAIQNRKSKIENRYQQRKQSSRLRLGQIGRHLRFALRLLQKGLNQRLQVGTGHFRACV